MDSRWAFDVDYPAEPARILPAYSLSEVPERIGCPPLMLAGEHFQVGNLRLSAGLIHDRLDGTLPNSR